MVEKRENIPFCEIWMSILHLFVTTSLNIVDTSSFGNKSLNLTKHNQLNLPWPELCSTMTQYSYRAFLIVITFKESI